MKRYDKITPDGAKDRLFEQCDVRRETLSALSALFAGRAYREVITPGFEFYDVFDSSSHYFPQESVYKLSDLKGRLLVARPDSTVPIARVVATRLRGHSLPIRLYYEQSVYSPVNGSDGRSSEIMQAGVELIGSSGAKSDIEVLTLAAEALERCGLADFRTEIGHIGIYKYLISRLDCDDAQREKIRSCIESKNYAALGDLLGGFDSPAARALGQLPRLFGGEEVFGEAAELFRGIADEELYGVLEHLRSVYSALKSCGLESKLMVDFGLVNRADYYTGIIFHGYISGAGEPVVSGGRYDGLIRDFGEDMPATGFGINVDLVTSALLQSGLYRVEPERVLVFCEEADVAQAFAYIDALRRSGAVAEFCTFDSLAEAKSYAQSEGISRVCVISRDGVKVTNAGGCADE